VAPQGSDRPPVVRTRLRGLRSRERRTSLHGVARASRGSGARSSAVIGSVLPGSPFGGGPVFPLVPRASVRRCWPRLSLPRAPLQGTPENRRRPCRPDDTLPGFPPLQRMRSRGSGSRGCSKARHLPPSAFRTLSTAYSPRHRPGLFQPGNAHGVLAFRALLLMGSSTSLEAACSLAVHVADQAAKRDQRRSTPEPCSPHRVRTAAGRNPLRRPMPSWRLPL